MSLGDTGNGHIFSEENGNLSLPLKTNTAPEELWGVF